MCDDKEDSIMIDDAKIKPRKRDHYWLDELTDAGEITPKKTKTSKYDTDGRQAITQYNYINGAQFEYAKCNHCFALLALPAGGHWTRHQKKACLNGKNNIDMSLVKNTMQDAIAEFCVKSGSSFRMTESSAFRDLLKTCMLAMNQTVNADAISLPCRQTIRNLVETKCDQNLQHIKDIITPHVKNGSATLSLDFGLHIVNFLAGFISFIELNDQGVPILRVEPFCFLPMYAVKTAENIKEELVRAGGVFDFSEDEILALNVITDGAANISSMGKRYFKNWALCGCHAIQKMSERLLNPKISLLEKYSEYELSELRRCSTLLEKCYKLALLVNKKKVGKYVDTVETHFF
ncbi:hypothetical protein CAEBREN_01039 [Caenorhabditis brenneri]|uniref:DUF659 domain-containing protein n=1 Tax=Caenorhabditis brenneri TaxID=135651 RepID=G0P738_CAEBE|nr:hypothetical protein CAEBREN_01039 [Caenorhabditis brenneri]